MMLYDAKPHLSHLICIPCPPIIEGKNVYEQSCFCPFAMHGLWKYTEYEPLAPVEVYPLQKVVRPTVSGIYTSSETYCEWYLYKR